MSTSSNGHRRVTRDQVLVAHAAEQIARTSSKTPRFAELLAEQLHLLVAEKAAEAGVPDFVTLAAAGDAAPFMKASAAWLKRVQRWLDAEIDLPSWVEEAWVQALEPEYRERCINELAARHGLIGARALGNDTCPVSAFAQLVIRLGQAVEVGSEVLADGKITAADVQLLPEFIEKLLAVESRSFELRRRAENELAIHTGGAPLKVVG